MHVGLIVAGVALLTRNKKQNEVGKSAPDAEPSAGKLAYATYQDARNQGYQESVAAAYALNEYRKARGKKKKTVKHCQERMNLGLPDQIQLEIDGIYGPLTHQTMRDLIEWGGKEGDEERVLFLLQDEDGEVDYSSDDYDPDQEEILSRGH